MTRIEDIRLCSRTESLPREIRRPFSWGRANPIGSLTALKRYPVVLGLTGTFFLVHLAHQSVPSTWVLYTSYRYSWSTAQVGLSLAIIGVMAAIVQGGLARRMIPALGERRAVMVGISNGVVILTAYGLATQGWMMYAILVVGSFGAISMPALQGLISRSVPLNEQGAVQGALSSVASLAGIAGPPLATGLFGFFISPRAPVQIPGIAFFMGSCILLVALVLTWRAFRVHAQVDAPVSMATA